MLFTGFSFAIRQDFQSTQATIITRLTITTSTYTAQLTGTRSANCSIHIPLTCHANTVPMTTAGAATTSISLDSISKMPEASAPFTLRMAISLLRRCTSSVVYPISHISMMKNMVTAAIKVALRNTRTEL